MSLKYSDIVNGNRLDITPVGMKFRLDIKCRVSESSEDISRLLDRLLQIASKMTETHTSDILKVIAGLEEAQEWGKPFCTVLAFHDHGIDPLSAGFDVLGNLYAYMPDNIPDNVGLRGHQFWLLAYAPGMPGEKIKGRTLLKKYDFPSCHMGPSTPKTDATE